MNLTLPPVVSNADQFAEWLSPENLARVRDPSRRMSITLINMSQSQSALLTTLGEMIQLVQKRMSRCNELLQIMNNAVQMTLTNQGGVQSVGFYTTDKAERDRIIADLRDTFGVKQLLIATEGQKTYEGKTAYYYEISQSNKSEHSATVDHLRLSAENLSSVSQQLQISLNKVLTNYSNSVEKASQTAKRDSDGAGMIISNL